MKDNLKVRITSLTIFLSFYIILGLYYLPETIGAYILSNNLHVPECTNNYKELSQILILGIMLFGLGFFLLLFDVIEVIFKLIKNNEIAQLRLLKSGSSLIFVLYSSVLVISGCILLFLIVVIWI